MQYSYQPKDPARKYRGLFIVGALHLLLAWAILSGTAEKTIQNLKKPLEAVVIQEVIIPPPPPPPVIKPILPPVVKTPIVKAPPPPFVPPVEVVTAPSPTPAPAITAVTEIPSEPAVIAPPTPPAPPKPGKVEMGLACPTQVTPEMPKKALQDGIVGVVKAQALIKGGVVTEVTILSGPRIFHSTVRAAMMQYKCSQSDVETVATQEFNFKID